MPCYNTKAFQGKFEKCDFRLPPRSNWQLRSSGLCWLLWMFVWLLCMFRSLGYVCCLCVNVCCTAATGCQPNVCCTAATVCQPNVCCTAATGCQPNVCCTAATGCQPNCSIWYHIIYNIVSYHISYRIVSYNISYRYETSSCNLLPTFLNHLSVPILRVQEPIQDSRFSNFKDRTDRWSRHVSILSHHSLHNDSEERIFQTLVSCKWIQRIILTSYKKSARSCVITVALIVLNTPQCYAPSRKPHGVAQTALQRLLRSKTSLGFPNIYTNLKRKVK
jgi:hypothetical protein